MIDHSDWKSYARQLNVTESDIQAIEHSESVAKEQRFEALFTWHKKQRNPTFQVLIEAANAISRPQVAQKIEELAVGSNTLG